MTPTQTESFVPLATPVSASSGERAEFRATVLSQPGQIQKFQTATSPAATITAPAASRTANCQPQVSVKRDGDRVTGIQIQCSCGEVIDLSCVYDAAGSQPVTAPEPAAEAEPATMPQPEAAEAKPGKICKDSGKDLPTSASKKPKVPEKGRGTSAAKRRSA
jgi:hypothetical protein